MPHYHNFSWYYFVKYVIGFAGMLFLYTGLLKEKKFTCICPAEARAIARRKEDNNESCPTGDRNDANAQRDSSTPSYVNVDARASPPISKIRRKKLVKRSVSPRDVKFDPKNREFGACRLNYSSLSSSDCDIEIRERKKHRPGCYRASKFSTQKNLPIFNAALSYNSKSVPICLRAENTNNRIILDAVESANLRVRNSFAEQEDRELEAFACSIFNRRIPHNVLHPRRRVSPNSMKLRMEGCPLKNIEFNNDCPPSRHLKLHRKLKLHRGRKHNCENASSPVASLRSRSGSVYLTATSSKGPRADCKIHGSRYCKNIVKSPEPIRCFRVTEESDASKHDIRIASSVDRRRKNGKQHITRYRSISTSISML